MAHSLMGHQPARILLLDASNPDFTSKTTSSVCDALENVLCIGANMAGPSRIPLFGVYLLTSYPEIILPLSCTKGNFVRLHSAVEDIRNCMLESLDNQHPRDVKPCIALAVSEACNQFRRYTSGLTQVPSNCSQLEVIILTGHSGGFVQELLRHLPDNFDLTAIKRILAATITGIVLGDTAITSDGVSGSALDLNCDGFGGMVDTLTLDCDSASLQRFFYSWLTETSSDSEHLHLILPPPCPADPALVIKCDLSERMICPFQLPFCETYSVHTESNICKHVYPPPSKALGMSVSLQKLKVVATVGRQSVCESILFGIPLLAVPTTCWKMDWDVLETNQENFVSLCSELHRKDQVLLTQAVDSTDESQQRSSKASSALRPNGYFVLMPSENKSMLLKSITPQELLLPMGHVITPGTAKQESVLRVQASLSEVALLNDLNPLKLTSGLAKALQQFSLPRSAVDKARAVKRKAAGPRGLCKAPSGQKEISDFLVPNKPEVSPQQLAPVPGGRLTANHWSNPLVHFSRAKSPAAQTTTKKTEALRWREG